MPRIQPVFVILLFLCSVTAAAANPASGEQLIGDLYRVLGCRSTSASAFKCHAPEADQRKAITEQNRISLGKYFDASLVSLLVKERQCVTRTQEICNLDFDPLYASQDPDAADLSIKAAAANRVIVSFRYPANGERITIRYLLTPTRKGLRISDVIYSDNTSLRKLLMTKLP